MPASFLNSILSILRHLCFVHDEFRLRHACTHDKMNLFQSHIYDGLELPVVPGPRDEWAAFDGITADAGTVKEVAKLLRSCDIQYL